MENRPDTKPQWIVALVAASGAITIGNCYGLSTVLIPALEMETDPELVITLDEGSIIATLWVFGIIFGCVFNGIVSDICGRKTALVWAQFPFLLSFAMIAMAPNLWTIYLGRVISGFADGAMFSNLPVYIGEISHSDLRGTLVSLVNVLQSFGMLMVYILGAALSWRTLNWVLMIPNAISLFLMVFFMPETPYYRIGQKRDEEARVILQKLRGPSYDPTQELQEIIDRRDFLERSRTSQNKVRNILSTLASSQFWKPFAIAAGIYELVLLTGTGTLTMYLVTIFQESGTSVDPYLATILVGGLRLIMSFGGSYSLKVFPRRPLYMISCFTMALCLASVGGSTILRQWVTGSPTPPALAVLALPMVILGNSTSVEVVSGDWAVSLLSWLPVVAMVGVYTSFCVGVETVTRCVCSEIFPTDVRSIGNALTVLVCTSSLIFVGLMMPIMLRDMGFSGTFFFFAGMSILALLYGYFFLPESQGKTLVMIEEQFDQQKKAKSKAVDNTLAC